ncbi:MAG: DoxX family protein [Cytophagales bacterium]|jgi:uncharacterized membrane protein YphA (DoxX/SURF4 family)|nr:DoxX family protein [Cytophagales bacterium]
MKKAIAFLTGSIPEESVTFNSIYLLFRLHVGLSMAIGAGLAKVFHKINEKGSEDWSNLAFGVPDWFVKQVGDIGFTFISPTFWAYLAVYGEFIGGLLIALGLFTRLSALQLAFQFFVVSYVWYEAPAPIVGMYYQQLIFFAFLMSFAVGDGRYSLARLFANLRLPKIANPAVAMVCLFFASMNAEAQTAAPVRVSFTVNNSSLRGKMLDFRHYNKDTKVRAAYGYSLNGMSSHATNLPAPVRVYEEKNGKKKLLFVVRAQDDGKSFSVNKEYDISREDYLEAARQELDEETANLAEANRDKTIAQTAKEKGLKMVTFRVKGASFLPTKTYVRVQLPWDTNPKANTGFTTSLSRFGEMKVSYPVGTKVYVCDGPYWEKDSRYTEKLIVTVDEEKENYTYSL